MQIYKRSLLWVLVRIIPVPLFSGLIVIIAGGFFIEAKSVLMGIGAAVGIIAVLIILFGMNIRFTITPEGQFTYYRNGKQKHQFELSCCQAGYQRVTANAVFHRITLQILPAGENNMESVYINASSLGRSRFDRMFGQIESFSINGKETLSAS